MVESVEYEVLRRTGKTEVRKYPRITLATVQGYDDNTAFGLLFDYIAGKNTARARVAMTVPVISSESSSEKIEMTAPVISDARSFSFVLPTGHDSGTAPVPLDTRVKLVDIPERNLGVLTFRGRATNAKVRRKAGELIVSLRRIGIEPKGESFLMRYNPPITPPFMRRNEVALEIP